MKWSTPTAQDMRSWHRLNIDISSALNSKFRFPLIHTPYAPTAAWDVSQCAGSYIIFPDPNELFMQEWLNKIKTALGFTRAEVAVFYTPANARYPVAHVDIDQVGKDAAIFGLNFVPFHDTRDMIWYNGWKVNDTLKEFEARIEKTPADTFYCDYPIVDEYIVDRCRVGRQLTLVRTDIPHRIDDPGTATAPRLTVSLRPLIPGVDTWKQAVEFFQPFMAND